MPGSSHPAARTQIADVLRESGRGSAGGRKRAEDLLVVSEIAPAFVLLIGAGLVVKSFLRLTSVERGFSSANLLMLSLSLPEGRYPAERVPTFYDELNERLAALPGVERVAAAARVPMLGRLTRRTSTSEPGQLAGGRRDPRGDPGMVRRPERVAERVHEDVRRLLTQ